MSRLIDSWREIQEKASTHDAVLVAYSGGKDSKVILDLCAKTFKRVEVFCMALVPGMRVTREALAEASSRYGVKTHEVQHWSVYPHLQEGVYGPAVYHDVKAGEKTVFAEISRKTGIDLIATGKRKSESFNRRAMLNMGVLPGWHPIAEWDRKMVMDYLAIHKIPVPENGGKADMFGFDLGTASLTFLYDNYLDDFQKVEQAFPFVRGTIARRVLRGIG